MGDYVVSGERNTLVKLLLNCSFVPPEDTKEQWLYSKLPLVVQTPHLSLSCGTWQRKIILATCICNLILSFATQSPLAIGEGWDVERLVNRELCLLAQQHLQRFFTTPTLHLMLHQADCPSHAIFPLTCEQDSDIKLPLLGQQLTPNPEGASQHFLGGNHTFYSSSIWWFKITIKIVFAHNTLILWKPQMMRLQKYLRKCSKSIYPWSFTSHHSDRQCFCLWSVNTE